MELQLSDGRRITSPSNSQIQTALNEVGRKIEFMILSQSEMNYVQIVGDKKKGYLLEYQAGSLEEHYRSYKSNIVEKRALEVLHLYNNGDSRWKESCEWKKEVIETTNQETLEPNVIALYKQIMCWTGLVLLIGVSIAWLRLDSFDSWVQSLGLELNDATIYLNAICFSLCYPWALEYKRRPFDIKDSELAGAWGIFFLAPFFIVVSLFSLFS